jgi:hypothetical protein
VTANLYSFFVDSQGHVQRDLIVHAIYLFAGFGLGLLGSLTHRLFQSRKEARENQKIDLSGKDWFAAWEASVDGEIVINTESLSISQSGAKVYMRNNEKSPENPLGGYLWKSELVFSHGETLMGWYYPTPAENITSRGIMYFSYDSQRKLFVGKWVGKSYDGNLCQGFGCISKDREHSREGLMKLIGLAKSHPVNVLGGIPFAV